MTVMNDGKTLSAQNGQTLCHIHYGSLLKRYEFTKNQIFVASSKLFSIINQLKTTNFQSDVPQFKQYLLKELRSFQATAEKIGYDTDSILIARFILSATLDEFIAKTPWGIKERWLDTSLLKYSKNEANTNQQFFTLLEKMCQAPEKHIDLIELAYICLSLGYEGIFKMQPERYRELQSISDQVYQTIRNQRGDFNKTLMINTDKQRATPLRESSWKTLWVSMSSLFVMLICIYFGLNYLLDYSSSQVNQQINTVVNSMLKQQN